MDAMRIEVISDDITNGVRGDADSCPIALAIKRVFPGLSYVNVDMNASWEIDAEFFNADLPAEAKLFIEAFDEGEHVQPFAFEMKPESDLEDDDDWDMDIEDDDYRDDDDDFVDDYPALDAGQMFGI